MPDVYMWWAQTDIKATWSSGAPPLVVKSVPGGLDISQQLRGPGPSSGSWSRRYDLYLTSTYWLGTDRMPQGGYDWRSQATDMTTGAVIGMNGTGYWPFGPWPSVFAGGQRRQRVFSGSTLIADDTRGFILLSSLQGEGAVAWQDVPPGVFPPLPPGDTFPTFPSSAFNFTRTQNLGIELRLWLTFSVEGYASQLELRRFVISIPQFIIRGLE